MKSITLLLCLLGAVPSLGQFKVETINGKPSRIKLKQVIPYSIAEVIDMRKDTVNLGMVQLEEYAMPSKNIILQIKPTLSIYIKKVLEKTLIENQSLNLALKIKQLKLKGTYDKHTVATATYSFFVLKDGLYYSLGDVNTEGIGWAEDAIKETIEVALKSLQNISADRYKIMKGIDRDTFLAEN